MRVPPPKVPDSAALAELADRFGLSVSGARPNLVEYIRQLWSRRHFISTFSRARLTAMYSKAKLGQVWQVVTPILNVAVYFLVFGVLLKTKRGIPDYIPFLVTGVFIFTFTQTSVMTGTRSVADNLGLIRAVHFPRACLPISFTLIQLQQLLISCVVLIGIILAWGQTPSMRWLLVIPALVLQATFNTGLALVMARIGSKITDMAQLMPFILRTWLYLSGVFYSIHDKLGTVARPLQVIMDVNPAAIYIGLVRFSLIDSYTAGQLPSHVWLLALGWAVILGIGGFVFFWQAEESYGRG